MSSLRLGYTAPDFEAQTTAGPIKFHDWIGDSWVSKQVKEVGGIGSLIIVCRQSCFLILVTLPLYVLQNLVRLLAVPPISRNVVSKSSVFLWIAMNSTVNGSKTSITMVQPTFNSLSYV